jgi:hypothetical protein
MWRIPVQQSDQMKLEIENGRKKKLTDSKENYSGVRTSPQSKVKL